MYDEEGIGLAATQVDFHKRLVVIDISETRDQPLVLINPEIIEKRGEDGIEEGCLSVPGARAWCLAQQKSLSKRSTAKEKNSPLKRTICWLSVSSTSLTTWPASCSLITCRH